MDILEHVDENSDDRRSGEFRRDVGHNVETSELQFPKLI